MADKPRKFIRRPAVQDRVGLPTSTLYDMIGKGRFPKPFQLSERIVAWDEEEVDAWQKQKIAARDASEMEAM